MTPNESRFLRIAAWACGWGVALAIFEDLFVTTAAFVVGWFAGNEIMDLLARMRGTDEPTRK